MNQHIAIIAAIIALAITMIKFHSRNNKARQAPYQAAQHAGDAAHKAGGYDQLIEMEQERRRTARQEADV